MNLADKVKLPLPCAPKAEDLIQSMPAGVSYMRLISAVLFACLSGSALAQTDMDSMQLAMELGSVIASEALCSLSFNQSAISVWIGDKVAADDMSFALSLNMMVQNQTLMFADMTTSGETAHCAAITQTATYYGFLQ